jgi:N-methylhydantoinase A/oxoprolinase/acetone carboxylase beta subunit
LRSNAASQLHESGHRRHYCRRGIIIDGKPQYATGEYIGDFQIHIPSVSVSSIGDGGGSIAWVDGRCTRVGPDSAGSNPGPVCYGRVARALPLPMHSP